MKLPRPLSFREPMITEAKSDGQVIFGWIYEMNIQIFFISDLKLKNQIINDNIISGILYYFIFKISML